MNAKVESRVSEERDWVEIHQGLLRGGTYKREVAKELIIKKALGQKSVSWGKSKEIVGKRFELSTKGVQARTSRAHGENALTLQEKKRSGESPRVKSNDEFKATAEGNHRRKKNGNRTRILPPQTRNPQEPQEGGRGEGG